MHAIPFYRGVKIILFDLQKEIMKITTAVILLFLCLLVGNACPADSQAPQGAPVFPDIEQNVQPFKKMADMHLNMVRQEKRLEEQIEQARKSPSPEIVQFRKEMNRLQAKRDRAASQLGEYRQPGGFLRLGVASISGIVGGVTLLFSLVVLYIWSYKRDIAFLNPYSDMRSALIATVKPSRGLTGKASLRRFFLIMAIASLILFLLALLTNPLWAAEGRQSVSGVVYWDVQKENFDQNVQDLKALQKLSGYSRLAFILEHPAARTVNLPQITSLWGKNGLVFKQEPAMMFGEKDLHVNSFEYLFLLGRCYYEDNKIDSALRYFAMAGDLKAHAFENQYAAESYLLNLLEIAISSKRISQFEELERQFLENADGRLQLALADFLVFKADRKEGRELFQRILLKNIEPAMGFLARVLQKLGADEAYGFCMAALDEFTHAKRSPEMLVELLIKNWALITSGNPQTHQKDYLELVKTATMQVKDTSIELQALQLLLKQGQRDFVGAELENIHQRSGGRLTVSDYLAVITLYEQLGDAHKAESVLEYAITQVFPYNASAMHALLNYCLEHGDYDRASKTLEVVFKNSPATMSSPTDQSFLDLLKIDLPLPWESLPLRGFYGLLQDRVQNFGNARSELEMALKPNLEQALLRYDQTMDLNINVLYLLLKMYQSQKDVQKFQAVYPLYTDSVSSYWSRNETEWRRNMDLLKKKVADLEKEKQELLPTPEEMKSQRLQIRQEIQRISRQAARERFKSHVNALVTRLIFLLAAIYSIGALVYVLCRAGHYARQAAHWRMAVFVTRFTEGYGFALMMTVVFIPVGVVMVLLSQCLLALLNKNETGSSDLQFHPHPEPTIEG